MALFDFFRKKNPPPQNGGEPVAQPEPTPVIRTEPPVGKPAEGKPSNVPGETGPVRMPQPPVASPKQTSSPPNGVAPKEPVRHSQQQVRWPGYGTDTAGLVAATQIKVFVDASFVKGPHFAAFSEAWRKNRVNRFATRYYFLPACEKEKLSPEEQMLISGEDCRISSGGSTAECFAQLVAKGLKWNVLWLTESAEEGDKVREVAKASQGIFLRWYGMDEDGKLKSLFTAPPERKDRPAPAGEKSVPAMVFPHCTQLVKAGQTSAFLGSVPGTGGRVIAPTVGKQFVLRDPVMTDHISITYRTGDSALYAKIYTVGALGIDLFENKARRMTREKIDLPGVCWPQDILTDGRGAFVGILVPASSGVQLSQSLFAGTTGMQKSFPRWDKRDICTVALTILRTANALQQKGVIFGCFNPASIYIASAEQVFFVDTDAWQLEGFPVLSRNRTFTPPELFEDEKKIRLFTADEDRYQMALLAFMIMMPGKYPYAKKMRKNDDESLRDMSFPFSIGEDFRRSQDAERPSGAWQIVWDHLPFNLCSNFYHTFHQNGKFAKPGTRLPARTWIDQIDRFKTHLESPDGAQSRMLFPPTFRRDAKRTFARCKICGREHPDFYFLRTVRVQGERINVWDKGYRVCLPCAVDRSPRPDANFTCKCCGRTFFYTNRTQIMHEIGKLDFDWSDQKWCRDCKRRTTRCSRCGKDVPLYQMREFRDEQRNLRKSVCGDCFGALIEEAKNRRNSVYRNCSCKSCGRGFSVTYGEKEFFDKKGYSLPTKCPSCRGR